MLLLCHALPLVGSVSTACEKARSACSSCPAALWHSPTAFMHLARRVAPTPSPSARRNSCSALSNSLPAKNSIPTLHNKRGRFQRVRAIAQKVSERPAGRVKRFAVGESRVAAPGGQPD
eukprot:COSAG01_NODE_14890_length_1398_cov_1.749808_1_plen_118_part_10